MQEMADSGTFENFYPRPCVEGDTIKRYRLAATGISTHALA